MGNSLQDQLLKSGLGNKKQAVKARKAQHGKQKLKAKGVDLVDEVEVLAEQANQKKVERDRELNRQRQQEQDRKAIQAQIRQLVELNKIEERGEIEYSYTDQTRIRTFQLVDVTRTGLIAGKLSIVRLGEDYEIIPRQVAEKIAERDPDAIVLKNEYSEDEADDEYADYKVPDDLMW